MSDLVIKRLVADERALDPALIDPDFFEAIPDWREVGQSLPTPTLLATSDSGIVTPEQAAELQRLNEHIEVANIENVGHAIVDQAPVELARAVAPFINEHSSP